MLPLARVVGKGNLLVVSYQSLKASDFQFINFFVLITMEFVVTDNIDTCSSVHTINLITKSNRELNTN